MSTGLLSAIRRVQIKNGNFPIRESFGVTDWEVSFEPTKENIGGSWRVDMRLGCNFYARMNNPSMLERHTALAKNFLANVAYGEIQDELTQMFPILMEVRRLDWELGQQLEEVIARLQDLTKP